MMENRNLENDSNCFSNNNKNGYFYSSDDHDHHASASMKFVSNATSPPNSFNGNGLWLDHSQSPHDNIINNDELEFGGLCQSLCRMSLQQQPNISSSAVSAAHIRGFNNDYDVVDPHGFGLPGGSNKASAFGFEDLHTFPRSRFTHDDITPALSAFGLRNGFDNHDDYSMGSFVAHNQFLDDFCSDSSCCTNRKCLNGGNGRAIDPYGQITRTQPEVDVSMNDMLYTAVMKQRAARSSNVDGHRSLMSVNGAEAFSSDQSFIIPENGFNRATNGAPKQNIQKKSSNVDACYAHHNLSDYNPETLALPPSFSFMAGVHGSVYLTAKDQYGCRFLQRICDEGSSEDVRIIFNETINHVVQLMMEPFGNYLVQKLLDVCNNDQITQVVHVVTKEPGQLVKIAFNTYGTRVIQKLIENLRTRQQIVAVKMAIQPGFLHLVKDLNGNHVIQRCLQIFSNEDNKFIFDAAAKFCVDMSIHQHGCCVLQRCIGYSTGEHREKLITEVALHGLQLAQDPYGNYVVQYIIDLKIPSAVKKLHAQFKGHYVQLSMQKFSSHVVEKWLKDLVEGRSRIVQELLSVPNFGQLLQDPYANYVIQSALKVTKGQLHDLLVEAVRSHRVLRTNPYSKKIFSRNLLKK
ncbi:hypothetical protein ACFE04_025673 [Oxalis oulophora]